MGTFHHLRSAAFRTPALESSRCKYTMNKNDQMLLNDFMKENSMSINEIHEVVFQYLRYSWCGRELLSWEHVAMKELLCR